MWFTENAWPPMLILVGLALAAGYQWMATQKKPWIIGAIAGLVLAVGCFYLEQWIVTDREQVKQQVVGIVEAFERGESEKVLNYFSPQAKGLRTMATLALASVKLKGMDVKDVSIELVSQGSEAISVFRANGNVTFGGTDVGHQPSRWKITWRREKGEWRIVEVVRLNPLKDEAMEIMERRPA